MPYLNLHAHTGYSDGISTMKEIVEASIKVNFCAAVITDHVYDNNSYEYSLTLGTFEDQLQKAKELESQYNFPVIIGAEVAITNSEEILVFGTEAIKQIIKIRDRYKQLTIYDLASIKEQYNCCYCLCHPRNIEKFIQQKGVFILDAYEYNVYIEHLTDDTYGLLPYSLSRICNSDAHSNRVLDRYFNEVEDYISDEKELISYIKNRRYIKPIINVGYKLVKGRGR